MKKTISIRLKVTKEQEKQLLKLQTVFLEACNSIVPAAMEHRCWNRVALHHLVYRQIRQTSVLGSQMVCNAIFAVCKAYRAKTIVKDEPAAQIQFHKNRSVHFDKRTYSIKGKEISLYTLEGRLRIPLQMGPFQEAILSKGLPKEGELICRKGKWFFNLVVELPDATASDSSHLLAVDLGENVHAATSSGKLYGGGKTHHERLKFLVKRQRLQSNGTQSSRQLLKKISGKEARRAEHINHNVSKNIIQEAKEQKAGTIVLEDLTHIRSRIKAGKKVRSRLHRWAFRELQTMIQYKAESQGIRVLYVNPAYSSKICSLCGCLGVRQRHHFKCLCGNQQHSDLGCESESLQVCAIYRLHNVRGKPHEGGSVLTDHKAFAFKRGLFTLAFFDLHPFLQHILEMDFGLL